MGMGMADPSLPRMVGRYALYDRFASGGMASVHIGRLVGPVGFARTVAIKRMHPQFAGDPEFVSMFLDEARLAARIRHPNVVPTLDVVAMEGELLLVMDFVHGESLARLIRVATERHERIRPSIVATIMAGVLHGLHAAHEATDERGEPLEVVHRDVSPHNVLVGVDGVARVLDFGVAKAVGRLQTTREGQLKGKIAYMAPEQIRGKVSRGTDIYAASVVLWEALTGKQLFAGENEGQVLDQVLRGTSVRPSTHAPDVPPTLDAVAMRGLNVVPALRYLTARDMACALEDAVVPAAASRIGEWVSRAAKQTLSERSARIARIESDSARRPVPPLPSGTGPDLQVSMGSSPSVQAGWGPRSLGGAPMPGGVVDDMLPTQLSSGSVSAPAGLPVAARRGRAAWIAVAGGLVLFGGGVALAKGLWGGAPAVSPQPIVVAPVHTAPVAIDTPAAAPSSAASASAAVDTPPPTPSIAPSAAAVDSAAAAPSSAPSVPVVVDAAAAAPVAQVSVAASSPPRSPAPGNVARPAPSTASSPPPAPATKTSPAATTNCDPPYIINDVGHRVRKPECR